MVRKILGGKVGLFILSIELAFLQLTLVLGKLPFETFTGITNIHIPPETTWEGYDFRDINCWLLQLYGIRRSHIVQVT